MLHRHHMINCFLAKNISLNSLKGMWPSPSVRTLSVSTRHPLPSIPILNTISGYGPYSLKDTSLRMSTTSIRLSLARPLKLPVQAFETSTASPTSATSLHQLQPFLPSHEILARPILRLPARTCSIPNITFPSVSSDCFDSPNEDILRRTYQRIRLKCFATISCA
ncbi:hypothetical protein DL98DRAFT_158729 [Cadophora sp. DSE1049]|nr:hypothetical protein DL98DRAFT_158729 [Cadophora sp. DSE1049]